MFDGDCELVGKHLVVGSIGEGEEAIKLLITGPVHDHSHLPLLLLRVC